jgi:acyl CoA:acetate/3-ketoacid CoA transferase beta subunit
MEQHYAFLKNNRVENIAVFASQDEELADRIAQEQGHDDAVWVGTSVPPMWATYDGTSFTPPTTEYLISIGILNPTPIEEPEVTND